METLTLARYEAQGNDFLIALLSDHELRDFDSSLDVLGVGRSDLARVVCDRNLGLGTRRGYVHSKGADGFVVGEYNTTDGQLADRVRMHLRNADGSFAETSGNGLACLAMASFDERIIGAGPLIPIETDAGEQRCTVHNSDSASLAGPATPITGDSLAERRSVEVAMNRVGQGPEIPQELDDRIRSTFGGCLHDIGTGDVGNPHLVIALAKPPIDCPSDELGDHAGDLGAAVANLGRIYERYFPEGINVEFIWPLESSIPKHGGLARTLMMSVWERGAGLTVSCGSGSVVAATLAHRRKLVRSPNDPPHVSAEDSHDAIPPSSYRVDMRTAPFPGGSGSGFRYSVHVVPASHEDVFRPQLGVEAERIETDLTFRLDHVPVLLADLAAMTAPQR